MVHLCACLIGRDFVSPGINNPDRWLFAAYGVVGQNCGCLGQPGLQLSENLSVVKDLGA